ncbi:hypothetical protein D3C76_1510130 [compost metagenome]
MVILENHADLTTQERHLAVFQPADVMAAKPNMAGAWPFDTTNQFKQGTLPRAGMAGQKRHLCRAQMEIDPLQGLPSAQISFTDLFKANHPY